MPGEKDGRTQSSSYQRPPLALGSGRGMEEKYIHATNIYKIYTYEGKIYTYSSILFELLK